MSRAETLRCVDHAFHAQGRPNLCCGPCASWVLPQVCRLSEEYTLLCKEASHVLHYWKMRAAAASEEAEMLELFSAMPDTMVQRAEAAARSNVGGKRYCEAASLKAVVDCDASREGLTALLKAAAARSSTALARAHSCFRAHPQLSCLPSVKASAAAPSRGDAQVREEKDEEVALRLADELGSGESAQGSDSDDGW